MALVGPSGAGKTSALRAIAGLVRPSAGRIALDQDVWFDRSGGLCRAPDERRVGLVFQEYALFPHMNVRQNVAYAGKHRADELLERFRIAHLAGVRPHGLSGGERQRVALARALAREPGVLLLDEPLAALDAHTRSTVRAELQELLRDLDLPTLLVTHDYEDAAALADQVGVLVEGRLLQLASPSELVAQPQDAFVAAFTGANVWRGTVQERANGLTRVRLATGEELYSTDELVGEVAVVIHPWEIAVALAQQDDSVLNVIRGEVRSVVPVGNLVRVTIGPVTADVTALSAEKLGLAPGVTAYASFKATGTRLLQV